jgi:hypothetical protein
MHAMPNLPDDSHLPLIQRVPPTSVASPSELRPRDASDVRWYKPDLAETIRLMSWRWIYFLPAAGLILLLFVTPAQLLWSQFLVVWWKLLTIAVVLPAGIAIRTAKNIIRQRTEPFCIHCGYELTNLPDNYNCPECGEPYTFRWIEEYRRDPHWFIERFKRRGDIPPVDVPFAAGPMSGKRKSKDGT